MTKLLELEPLSAQDAVRMLDELLGGGLPAALRDLVVERAEGNPFFVEELLSVLIDRGLLARESGRLALPAAAARLDALAALKERPLVEREAPPLLQPGTLPRAVCAASPRAVRGDEPLIAQAADRFAAMGLNWHAEQTPKHLALT
jgi:hypothetical protein